MRRALKQSKEKRTSKSRGGVGKKETSVRNGRQLRAEADPQPVSF